VIGFIFILLTEFCSSSALQAFRLRSAAQRHFAQRTENGLMKNRRKLLPQEAYAGPLKKVCVLVCLSVKTN
jgi:hypothetical protein